ncbi:hypothetical protein L207DRAFT_514521 [Hyaloscypha variabilis F]|uniref:Uncharacterized protein n=1 Tax=Hyaloscypha variabilis (strain UAMH 11265 / GT02V1 / F) TaxID=1149755 RepID=A0A2J6RFC0_HYAVF|nr:hypothetical protein L207DRAFT_514521 [Hyaloscypha variabilis F]
MHMQMTPQKTDLQASRNRYLKTAQHQDPHSLPPRYLSIQGRTSPSPTKNGTTSSRPPRFPNPSFGRPRPGPRLEGLVPPQGLSWGPPPAWLCLALQAKSLSSDRFRSGKLRLCGWLRAGDRDP